MTTMTVCLQVKEEKIAEKLNLRKEYEQSVLEKNTTTEQLYNTLQAQSACTKAAQYVRNKAHAVMHRSAKLVSVHTLSYFISMFDFRYQEYV